MLYKETLGVDRAVGYARKGEAWLARDQGVDMAMLLAAEMARRSTK